jgi:fluoride ion exporter CrcB/FEX
MTYSTFGYETVRLAEGVWWPAVANVTASRAAGLAAAASGAALMS